METLERLLDKIEEDMLVGSMLNMFQYGMALKVIEDKLWNINPTIAQRCNKLQHKILKDSI